MNCPFCELDHKRNKVIYNGKTVFVALSNPRLAKGHLLVIPKRHIEKPSQMNRVERTELFDIILKFQDKITSLLAKGCDIRENYHPFRKADDHSKVDHIHFHLIPRDPDDEIYQTYEKLQKDVFKFMSEREIEESYNLWH
jgi:diadenosine tetraphosphate (Ap4A) HIT family hydrolase